MNTTKPSEIKLHAAPRCPNCGKEMPYYGGTRGYMHCGWKLLYRADGWLDAAGEPVRDRRISAEGTRPDATSGRRVLASLRCRTTRRE
jgi:hypothetical protein